MSDVSDDEGDAMASVRMLYVMLVKLRQFAPNGNPYPSMRVPRLPAALAEADRPFNQTYCNRHPKVFRDNYRVNHHVFDSLVEICDAQITEPIRSKRELLGVTLDWLATDSSVRAQEDKFKIAYSTCHKYRTLGMKAIIGSLQHLISLPSDVCPEFALRCPHFNQALCAIDGVHFQLQVAEEDASRFRSRKGTTTTNVLIASDWNLQVAFVDAGVEGNAHDSSVLSFSGFMASVPANYYVLADAGYAFTTQVLTPYRGVRYHLQEWGPRCKRPQNFKELFNLKHAKARNIVERLIGVLKRRFRALRHVNECELVVVKATIFACCCLHNLIRRLDSTDTGDDFAGENELNDDDDVIPFDFESGTSWRDYIANQMWFEYEGFRTMFTTDASNQG